VGYGFNLGVLLEPVAGTRFGIAYRSEVKLGFKDVASASNVGPVLQGALKGDFNPNAIHVVALNLIWKF
jgi:long-chain fatty acid transport protein